MMSILRQRLRSLLKRLDALWEIVNKSDDFRKQPYGYLTNQVGHMFLGMQVMIQASALWFIVAGEYPQKAIVLAAWALIYLIGIEGLKQGAGVKLTLRRMLDSAEDTVFAVVFGAGIPANYVSEVYPGSPIVSQNLVALAGWSLVAAIWILFGTLSRVKMPKG